MLFVPEIGFFASRYFELVAFVVNGKVAEEVFYLTDTVNMLQVILIIKTRTMIMSSR